MKPGARLGQENSHAGDPSGDLQRWSGLVFQHSALLLACSLLMSLSLCWCCGGSLCGGCWVGGSWGRRAGRWACCARCSRTVRWTWTTRARASSRRSRASPRAAPPHRGAGHGHPGGAPGGGVGGLQGARLVTALLGLAVNNKETLPDIDELGIIASLDVLSRTGDAQAQAKVSPPACTTAYCSNTAVDSLGFVGCATRARGSQSAVTCGSWKEQAVSCCKLLPDPAACSAHSEGVHRSVRVSKAGGLCSTCDIPTSIGVLWCVQAAGLMRSSQIFLPANENNARAPDLPSTGTGQGARLRHLFGIGGKHPLHRLVRRLRSTSRVVSRPSCEQLEHCCTEISLKLSSKMSALQYR